MERTILTTTEVSEMTGVPVGTLKWYRNQQVGPASYRLGRRVVYDLAEIERWIDQQRRAGTREKGA